MITNDLADTLRSQLEGIQLETSGRAHLVGADETDPGTCDWWAKANLPTWPEDRIDGDDAWEEADGVALAREEVGDGQVDLTVLRMNGLTVDPWRVGTVGGIYDALDARSADYEHFVPLFRNGSVASGYLNPKLDEQLEAAGGTRVVIIDRVTLAPAWRGIGGVGRLLIAGLLEWVAGGARMVATHPFPTDLHPQIEEAAGQRSDDVLAPDLERVRRTWSSLGFRPFTEDIYVLDVATVTLDSAREELESSLLGNHPL
jgi:hypothetical protein